MAVHCRVVFGAELPVSGNGDARCMYLSLNFEMLNKK